MRTNFVSAEIEIVIHATENEIRVLRMLEEVLGIKPDKFNVNIAKGYFDNEIKILRANIKEARDLAYKVADMMSKTDRSHIRNNLELYTDGRGSLYLRISKQDLFKKCITLSQTDAIKIRFRVKREFKPAIELEYFKELVNRDGA